MTRCDTSTDGEANLMFGEIIRDVETKLNETMQPWLAKWKTAFRVGRYVYNGLANDAAIVRNYLTQNYENALSNVLGFRMAVDFMFSGFGGLSDLFVPFFDGDIDDVLARKDFSEPTSASVEFEKNEKNA